MEKIDYLQREEFEVQDIYDLIDYHSKRKSNISFAIDGEWGCGKSFVLEMVEEKLKAKKTNSGLEDRYVVFHYNCWEYDYYDEPLVAIVSMMIEQIENEKIFTKEEKKKFVAVLKTAALVAVSCLNAQLEEKTDVDFNALIQNLEAAEEGKTELIKSVSDFDPLWEFKRALKLLKKQIAEIAQKRTVVFVVDELDRCLPEYAIKVLERLHHISEGVENLITVIAVDKSRLLDSISNAFGYDKSEVLKDSEKYRNSERYMKKFVDYYYPLDKGAFLSPDDSIKYKTYLDLFDNDKHDNIIDFSYYIYELFNEIDMREQEHLVEKAEMIHTIVNENNKEYDISVMLMELLITVFYSCYMTEIEDLYSFLTDFENEDNLKDFRNRYFKILPLKNKLLAWYAAFLKETDFLGEVPDDLESSDGISRDTSIIKEKYGIDMEENLRFLCEFYDKLITLS